MKDFTISCEVRGEGAKGESKTILDDHRNLKQRKMLKISYKNQRVRAAHKKKGDQKPAQ